MATRIIIRASILIIALIGIAGARESSSVQGKPDLSGTWMLDRSKSSPVGKPSKADMPVKISHHDPELKIMHTSESNGQTVVREFVYYTDGRGETNQATVLMTTNPGDVKPSDIEREVTKSKTRWSGNKVVTRSILRMSVAGHMLEYELIDGWKLSSDGKTLTQTSKVVFQQSSPGIVFVPASVPDTRKVYNRI